MTFVLGRVFSPFMRHGCGWCGTESRRPGRSSKANPGGRMEIIRAIAVLLSSC